MTVNLKPVVEFLKKQPDFPIRAECLVDSDYTATSTYEPIGVQGHNSLDVSNLAKWISESRNFPEYGYFIWAFNYSDLFRRIFESDEIPEDIKHAIETHCPDLEPSQQAAKIIDDFIVTPFFTTHKIRLVQVYVVFPPGGSFSPVYSQTIKYTALE